jgi:CRP-like cAMP-binding protein
MASPWITKMEQFTCFSSDERARLETLSAARQEDYAARQDIVREGDTPTEIHIVLSGLATRYALLPDGSRQIMAFLIPGDMCDAEVFVLSEMDHSIGALAPTRCAVIPARTMKGLLREVSPLAEALWWSTMTDSAVLRQRIVDHGRRDARERIAHLFYEMLIRYRMVGLAPDNRFEFPVTQDELADATGLTPVHVNRMVQQLRDGGLIEMKGKVLRVIDPEGLKQVARFNANYLHLADGPRGEEGSSRAVPQPD